MENIDTENFGYVSLENFTYFHEKEHPNDFTERVDLLQTQLKRRQDSLLSDYIEKSLPLKEAIFSELLSGNPEKINIALDGIHNDLTNASVHKIFDNYLITIAHRFESLKSLITEPKITDVTRGLSHLVFQNPSVHGGKSKDWYSFQYYLKQREQALGEEFGEKTLTANHLLQIAGIDSVEPLNEERIQEAEKICYGTFLKKYSKPLAEVNKELSETSRLLREQIRADYPNISEKDLGEVRVLDTDTALFYVNALQLPTELVSGFAFRSIDGNTYFSDFMLSEKFPKLTEAEFTFIEAHEYGHDLSRWANVGGKPEECGADNWGIRYAGADAANSFFNKMQIFIKTEMPDSAEQLLNRENSTHPSLTNRINHAQKLKEIFERGGQTDSFTYDGQCNLQQTPAPKI